MSAIALATAAERAELHDDDKLGLAALRALGVDAEPAVWDDPAVDWARYDLVVIRSTWDYIARRDAFLAWADALPRLANPAAVVRWNTDKRYLESLAAAGVPVVPTRWSVPDAPAGALPGSGEWVVKPAVSAGATDTARYRLDDATHRTRAAAHVDALLAAGRVAMLQPYLDAVDSAGETALVYLGGRYSHAVRKAPILGAPSGPPADAEALFRDGWITPREPSAAEREIGARVLDVLPSLVPEAASLCYARVDLVPGPGGTPVLLELELTEPSLFLGYDDGAAARFAAAVLASRDA